MPEKKKHILEGVFKEGYTGGKNVDEGVFKTK